MVNRSVAVLAVAVLLLFSGCTGAGGGDSTSVQRGADQDGGSAVGPGSYYENGERVVIREAFMRVEIDDFEPAFTNARQIARSHGGYVAGWDHEIDRGWERGTLTIRVPAGNFSDARDDFAAIGTLEREDVSEKDFTAEYEATTERLQDRRAERRNLRRLLNRTDDVEEARRIREDLAEIRSQIRELETRQATLERREALSTIRLTIHEPPGDRPPKNYRSAFGFDDAFLDAFYGGLTAVKYVIVFFGYAIPAGFAAVMFGGFALVWLRMFRWLRANLGVDLPSIEIRRSDGSSEGRTAGDDGASGITDESGETAVTGDEAEERED